MVVVGSCEDFAKTRPTSNILKRNVGYKGAPVPKVKMLEWQQPFCK